MSTTDDEIALLVADIQRWAGQDARIHTALQQLVKVYEAEVQALAFEALELERALVRHTTATTEARIRASEHNRDVRWVDL